MAADFSYVNKIRRERLIYGEVNLVHYESCSSSYKTLAWHVSGTGIDTPQFKNSIHVYRWQ